MRTLFQDPNFIDSVFLNLLDDLLTQNEETQIEAGTHFQYILQNQVL